MNSKKESLKKLESLHFQFSDKTSSDIIKLSIKFLFKNKICYVCSFGSESAIILHMISITNKNFPIIFLNTQKLFHETILYKDILKNFFKLKNIIEIFPSPKDKKCFDPKGDLWSTDPDKCCDFRKVTPLKKILNNYDAWFSGRKSYHSEERKKNQLIELQDEKFLISPLIYWKKIEIANYFKKFKIPQHPLFENGFTSIGCESCTVRSFDEMDARSGRWVSFQKTECGIHKKKKTNNSETFK
tara:strand:+ start:1042 stop:1770 length:729 start_codon:yes stop_codon:yes gene_type:complete